MSYELLVGLQVKDESLYAKYRQAMTPILTSYGGGFRYDFIVSKTLITQTKAQINRVFVIFFSDKEAMTNFFKDPEYLKVKAEFFENSVAATTIISEYATNNRVS